MRRGPARGRRVGRRAAPAVAGLRRGRRVGGARPVREAPGAGATAIAAAEARAEALAVAAGDLPGALAAAIEDPGRIEVVDADGVAGLEPWLRGQDAVGVGLVVDDPRPLAGTPLALAVAGDRTGGWSRPRAPRPRSRSATSSRRLDAARRARGQAAAHRALRRASRTPTPLPVAFDTQIAAYLVNAALRAQKIADVVAERLDLVLPPAAAGLPPVAVAGLEALGSLAVRPSLEQALRDDGVDRLFAEIELPLIPILARHGGRRASPSTATRWRRWSVEFAAEIARLEGEIYDVRRPPVHDRQPQAAGRDPVRRARPAEGPQDEDRATRPTRPCWRSCAASTRSIEPVLDWRIYTKLRSTYVEALPTLLGPDGRLHTLFHQAVAATGRLSSSDPNLQNIPIRTPLGRRIRHAFVAGSPDTTLVAADYSQIELRILAHVSATTHLRDAFEREADIHRETAARVLRKPPEDVTADERSMAKMVNFGLAYGMSDFGLSSRAGISRQEAQEFINSYFAAYGGISRYMLHIRETAAEQGYVSTLLGRKRQIPELRSANRALKAAGERMAINMPIQGTAADIMKIAMIRHRPRRCATAGSGRGSCCPSTTSC